MKHSEERNIFDRLAELEANQEAIRKTLKLILETMGLKDPTEGDEEKPCLTQP